MTFLNNELSVYVPSNVAGEVKMDQQAYWVKTFQRMFCEIFGGCTTTKAEGCWMGKDGEIVTEDIVIVTVNFGDMNYNKIHPAYELIANMKESMQQEAVTYKKNGVLAIL